MLRVGEELPPFKLRATCAGSRKEFHMSLANPRNQLPDYAKDLRLNLDSVLSAGGSPGLDDRQIRAVALASAIASRHARVG
ncbi:MAG: hypothetical protein M3485_09775 [Pseudomonadota bacterium]|nr:hypothetical protein [Pseudomonadota bacterium]